MSPRKKPQAMRCAIYTRKSTEEGLEQEFNTLDAQREAGETYIRSQRHPRRRRRSGSASSCLSSCGGIHGRFALPAQIAPETSARSHGHGIDVEVTRRVA